MGDNDSNAKVAEGCSTDGGDDEDDDVCGGDGKWKVDCEDEADDDGDNDKADCQGDDGDDSGNSNDGGSVDENDIFENWCVNGEGRDVPNYGDKQTESVAGGLAKCNGSSKFSNMKITVGVMRWGILEKTKR